MNTTTYDNSILLEQQRRRLEGVLKLETCPTVYRPTRHPLIARLGNALLHWLTLGHGPRIRIFQQNGVNVWRVYDPVSNRTQYFTQEDEVRDWLDQRYYS